MTFNRVLVTGGTGFVGSRLKKRRPEWTYVSSADYDLVDPIACAKMFADIKPQAVVHLAGAVGGVKYNSLNQASIFYKNIMINTNVLHQAYESGVSRVLSCLATCAFPANREKYPFNEEDLLAGHPEETNLSFAYAKRCLHIQSVSYRKQHDMNYSCFAPSNLYGPEDSFDPEKSHFVSSMVRKLANATPGEEIEFWGTGKPRRQQLYVDDLAKIIPALLAKHNTSVPLIVAPKENLSVSEMINVFLETVDKKVHIVFNNQYEGQLRKDGDNAQLLKLLGEFEFTPFREGIKKTYDWYNENE